MFDLIKLIRRYFKVKFRFDLVRIRMNLLLEKVKIKNKMVLVR